MIINRRKVLHAVLILLPLNLFAIVGSINKIFTAKDNSVEMGCSTDNEELANGNCAYLPESTSDKTPSITTTNGNYSFVIDPDEGLLLTYIDESNEEQEIVNPEIVNINGTDVNIKDFSVATEHIQNHYNSTSPGASLKITDGLSDGRKILLDEQHFNQTFLSYGDSSTSFSKSDFNISYDEKVGQLIVGSTANNKIDTYIIANPEIKYIKFRLNNSTSDTDVFEF